MKILNKHLAAKEICESWLILNESQKLFAKEYLKVVYPSEKKKLDEFFSKLDKKSLNEGWADWVNTALDVIGIIDPTGIADALSGVIYLVRGEYLFGFLSLVSVIPYAGDAIAKPIMGALKLSKPGTKVIENAMKLSKAGKTAEASKLLADSSKSGGLVGWFTSKISGIAPKFKSFIEAIPAGPFKGFKNTILEWIELFSKSAKEGKVARQVTSNLAKRLPRMNPAEQLKNLENLKNALKTVKGPFRGFEGANVGWKTLWGGMPRLFGNRSTRALMRKTKWYLGLLDFMGLGNWVGPDELEEQVGPEKLNQSVNEYNNTPEAQQYLKDEFGEGNVPADFQAPQQQIQPPVQQPAQPSSEGGMMDPLADMLKSMVTGRVLQGAVLAI